jgi:hypothetical protein
MARTAQGTSRAGVGPDPDAVTAPAAVADLVHDRKRLELALHDPRNAGRPVDRLASGRKGCQEAFVEDPLLTHRPFVQIVMWRDTIRATILSPAIDRRPNEFARHTQGSAGSPDPCLLDLHCSV